MTLYRYNVYKCEVVMLKTTSKPLWNHELAIEFKENLSKSLNAKLKRAVAKTGYGPTSLTNFDKALAFAERHPENHQIFYPGVTSPLYHEGGLCIIRKSPYRCAEYDNNGILRRIEKKSKYGSVIRDVIAMTYDIYINKPRQKITMGGQSSFKDVLSGGRKIKEIYDKSVKEWNERIDKWLHS